MTEVLRFTHSSGTTSFYYAEVPELEHYPQRQRINVDWDQYANAYMNLIGDSWQEVNITFRLFYKDTITKIKTLYDLVDSNFQPERIRCYYEYDENTGTNILVQMRRDQYREIVNCGRPAAHETMKIQFIQSLETPGMLLYPEIKLLGAG
jgi:hypothetical protein